MFQIIEDHYKKHFTRACKSAMYRAGTQWAGEDCVQEAYYRCMKYIGSYNPDVEFNRWFSTILNNCIREYKNQEKGHSVEQFSEDENEGTECPSQNHHIYWGVQELINNKPEPMKEILSYHFLQEYSPIDISRITPHSYANTHKIIQRFKEELKELYK